MSIPSDHQDKFAYHFTHFANLDSIIRHGLLANNEKDRRRIGHRNIASMSVQRRRSRMNVTCGRGGTVHDYVPFYFCSVNPMLLSVLNAKNVDQQFLLFLCVPIQILLQEGTVFTDASANTTDPPNFYDDPADLDRLNWTAINSRKWSVGSDEERHQRMAELMIYKKVPIENITHIVTWNTVMQNNILELFARRKVPAPTIEFDPFQGRHFYFTKFGSGQDRESLVTGPHFFKQSFENTVAEIRDNRAAAGSKVVRPYHNLRELLAAIAADFSAIDEMADVFDLEVDYGGRIHNVTDHTLAMVERIKKDAAYRYAKPEDKQIMLLACYLHGIGKAPLNQTAGEIHKIFADYPRDSMEKLVRLLTMEVAELSDYAIRKVALLVGYHDLVSDIVLREREEEQLFDLVTDEKEVDMLTAVALAGIDEKESFTRATLKRGAKALRKKLKGR